MEKLEISCAYRVEISREMLKKAFLDVEKNDQPHQADVLIKLYKLVFGKAWDAIEKVHGWPRCGKGIWEDCCRMFRDFDCRHHRGVMAGGLWLNNGFSFDERLPIRAVVFDGKISLHRELGIGEMGES